jgi:hypothetical protein
MISILQQPGAFSFSRNPMVYQLQSDALYAAPGSKYVGLLSFIDFPFSDYTFQLSYGDIELGFTVPVGGPADDSGYVLPSPNGRTEAAFLAGALAALQANYYFDRDFTLDLYSSNGLNYIRFQAKEKGSQYTLSIADPAHVSIQQLQAGTDQAPQPNFRLFVELWMQKPGSAQFERLSTAYPEVDNAGNCTIDISGSVSDGLAAPGFDRPSLALPAIQACTNSVRPYYLKIAEVWGDKQTIRAITNTAVKTAIYGGFSKRMREQLAFPGYFQSGTLIKFLDQEAPVKITHLKQPEFLTFCALNGPLPIVYLSVTVTYADNTSAHYTLGQAQNIPQYGKYCFPVGYSQLHLGLFAGNLTVAAYTVVLTDAQGNELSETRTYQMDYTYRPYGRYLVYQNSFGSYVTSFTYGKTSYEYDLTFQSAEITPKGGFQLINGEKLDYNQQIDPKLTVATGFMSRRALQCYRDLILSRDKFLLDKGVALPITILSKTIKEFKDGDNLYALSFDLGFQWSEDLYTYDPDEPDPYSPTDLSNYVPPTLDQTMPVNFDDRYYLKTQTYNKVEVDGLLAAEIADRQSQAQTLDNEINALTIALANKADLNHTHDDRYYTKAEINDFLIGIAGSVVLEYESGTVAPIVFTNWQADYISLGNYPTIIVLQQSADDPTLYQPRAELQPARQYNADKSQLLSLSIDAPLNEAGTLRETLQIILKR